MSEEERLKLEVEKKKVLNNIQTICLTAKGGIPVEGLNREYRELIGQNIPFRKFGYNSLNEFLDGARDYCRVTLGHDGSFTVKAKVEEETAHLALMISRQNSKKKRSKPPARPSYRMGQNFRQQQNFGGGPRFDQMKSPWGQGFGGIIPRYNFGPGAASAPRFGMTPVGSAAQKPSTSRSSVGRPTSSRSGPVSTAQKSLSQTYFTGDQQPQRFNAVTKQNQQQQQQQGGTSSSATPDPKKLNQAFLRIASLVENSPNGIWCSRIEVEYSRKFQKNLPKNWTDVIEKHQTESGQNKLIFQRLMPDRCLIVPAQHQQSAQTQFQQASARTQFQQAPTKTQCIDQPAQTQFQQASTPTQFQQPVQTKFQHQPVQTQSQQATDQMPFQKLVDHQKQALQRPHEQTDQKEMKAPVVDPRLIEAGKALKQSTSHCTESQELQHKRNLSIWPISPIKIEGESSPKSWRLALSQPKLPKFSPPDDHYWDVYVTKVHSASEIDVRLFGEDYSDALENLADQMEEYYHLFGESATLSNQVQVGRIYVVEYDEEWHRVRAITICPNNQIKCDFIDAGGDAHFFDVDQLKEIHPKFLNLAPQTFHIQLAGLENIKSHKIAKILEKMILNQSLVAEVYSHENNQISVVLIDTSSDLDIYINQEILKISAQNGHSFGDIFASDVSPLEPEISADLIVQTSRGENLQVIVDNEEVICHDLLLKPLSGFKPLEEAPLPKLNQDFDIYITFAISPSDFTIQLLQKIGDLEQLCMEMACFYSLDTTLSNIIAQNISQDPYCAAICGRNNWCRVFVERQLDEQTFKCWDVDYGFANVLKAQQLQPLWPQFRRLPKMAIKANLADIKPKEGDQWSYMEKVWFAKHTQNKPFVSYFRGTVDGSGIACLVNASPNSSAQIAEDMKMPCRRMELSLIDTSGDEDVNVAGEMVRLLGSKIRD